MKDICNIRFYLNFTVSKIVAILILMMAFVLDILQHDSSFEIALPVIVILITGKQYFDYKGVTNKNENEIK